MQVSGSYGSPAASVGFRHLSAASGGSASAKAGSASGTTLKQFAGLVARLRDAHRAVGMAGRFARGSAGSARAKIASAAPLTLTSAATAATLRSTEEVNTIPTSWGPSEPSFAGSSSSSPTLSGTYSGVHGDTTLTFTATVGGVVGLTPIQIEVRDSSDTLVDTLSLGFGYSGGQLAVSGGLQASFGSGSIAQGDSFDVDVFASVGSAARPGNAFNGSGDASAGLEPGTTVNTGSFDLNGINIAVAASDTLDAVLARITASAAGVDAAYDAATDSVVLTHQVPGAAGTITLANDTSGLLAALKLEGASSTSGVDDQTSLAIDQVAALAGVATGDFSINGTLLTVDVSVDSLDDLLARINAADVGVTATFDALTGSVQIMGDNKQPFVLDDGTSGVFSALGITLGKHSASSAGRETRFKRPDDLRRAVHELVGAYNDVFEGGLSGFGSSTAGRIRRDLEASVAEAFEAHVGKTGSGTLRSGLGLDFVRGSGAERELFLNSSLLGRALDREADQLATFVFARGGDGARPGLVAGLGEALGKALDSLAVLLGPGEVAGLSVDVSG